MPSEHQTHLRTPVRADPAAVIAAGIGLWRAIAAEELQAAFLAESVAGCQGEATPLSHDVTEAACAEAT